MEVVEAASAEDGMSVIVSDSAIHTILMDWTLGDDKGHAKAKEPAEIRAVAQRQDPHLPDGRTGRGHGDPARRHGDGQRVRLDARGHGGVCRRPGRRREPALSGRDAAAPGGGPHEVQSGVRVFLAHARTHGRHGVSQVARGPRLLRLLRREPAALRSLDQRRRSGIAARPHRSDRRAREVRGPRVRRAPHLLRDQRHVHVEPRDLHGRGRSRIRSRCAIATATSRSSTAWC